MKFVKVELMDSGAAIFVNSDRVVAIGALAANGATVLGAALVCDEGGAQPKVIAVKGSPASVAALFNGETPMIDHAPANPFKIDVAHDPFKNNVGKP